MNKIQFRSLSPLIKAISYLFSHVLIFGIERLSINFYRMKINVPLVSKINKKQFAADRHFSTDLYTFVTTLKYREIVRL